MSRTQPPIADFHGSYESSCGYCKEKNQVTGRLERKANGRQCVGMHAYNLPSDIYEDLVERNWRRSGSFLYQPENDSMCCPQYAIRLDVTKFKSSKNHRKVLKKMQRFIEGEEKEEHKPSPAKQTHVIDLVGQEISSAVKNAILNVAEKHADDPIISLLDENEHERHLRAVPAFKQKVQKRTRVGDYTCDIVVVLLGKYKKIHKGEKPPREPKELAELIANQLDVDQIDHIECAENGYINIFTIKTDQLDPIAPKNKKQRMEIPSPQPSPPPTQKHKFTTIFAPSVFTQEEFEIYKKYQIVIHQDLPEDVTEKGYTRFLCNTPLMDITKPRNNKPFKGYGSFHLQYRIDGKLIGVSVVDVLEKGMSSVYFFYLPEYSHLSLGVYSALYEIDLIAKEKEKCPEFTYYYLGYYIHSCTKMKYKAQYEPSQLLCPVTFTWVDLKECTPKLDKAKYCAFVDTSETRPAQEETIKSYKDVNVNVLCERKIVPLKDILRSPLKLKPSVLKNIQQFCDTVGPHAWNGTLLYFLSSDDL